MLLIGMVIRYEFIEIRFMPQEFSILYRKSLIDLSFYKILGKFRHLDIRHF